jgi:AsmA-like C-terminal region
VARCLLQVLDLGNTALHGSVTLQQAKLDKYPGIAGTLDSHVEFGGTLQEVNVTGSAVVSDFMLKSAKHVIAVRSQFSAGVDATQGEVRLEEINGSVGKSGVHAKGTVAKNAKTGRRETSLDFAIGRGRVEDFLWLFNTAPKPPMNGPATASGHIRVTTFGPAFLKSIELSGKFEIHDGHFQKTTQAKVNELSARAQGVKLRDVADAPDAPVGSLASNARIEKGVAQFSQLFFEVPGARARVQGNYNLSSHAVNLNGDLWTDETVSRDTTGIKAILLKPVDPIFKRKHAGAMVGVTMTGDIDDPQFGTYLTKTKKSW